MHYNKDYHTGLKEHFNKQDDDKLKHSMELSPMMSYKHNHRRVGGTSRSLILTKNRVTVVKKRG